MTASLPVSTLGEEKREGKEMRFQLDHLSSSVPSTSSLSRLLNSLYEAQMSLMRDHSLSSLLVYQLEGKFEG